MYMKITKKIVKFYNTYNLGMTLEKVLELGEIEVRPGLQMFIYYKGFEDTLSKSVS